MTQPIGPHVATPGPCDSETCDAGDHVCTTCGGGVTAFIHLPEARGEAVPQATVEAGAAQTVPVQHADAGSGGEATK